MSQLKRIVRMEFQKEKVADFLLLFNEVQPKIAKYPGCSHVELCKDASASNIYYTFSLWESEDSLEDYRYSNLFKETWARTKVLFSAKPQAFSLIS